MTKCNHNNECRACKLEAYESAWGRYIDAAKMKRRLHVQPPAVDNWGSAYTDYLEKKDIYGAIALLDQQLELDIASAAKTAGKWPLGLANGWLIRKIGKLRATRDVEASRIEESSPLTSNAFAAATAQARADANAANEIRILSNQQAWVENLSPHDEIYGYRRQRDKAWAALGWNEVMERLARRESGDIGPTSDHSGNTIDSVPLDKFLSAEVK